MTAPPEPQRPIGLLVGGGNLPLEIARNVLQRGGRVHVVGIAGEADQDWSGIPHTMVGWGSIGGMIAALRDAGCRELLIIGRVRRPDPWRLRPDLGFFLNLPRIMRLVTAGGDDSLLRRIVRFFEDHGLTVRGPADVAPDLVAAVGALGSVAPAPEVQHDIALGFSIIRALGAFDIGQAVVVAAGRLVAVEGAEGTDGLLRRLPMQRVATAGPSSGVLVKCPKPGQELRVDMPVIGPQTVTLAAAQGLRGIAVAAGGVLLADRSELTRQADAAGLFVAGVDDAGWRLSVERARKEPAAPVRVLSGPERLRTEDIADAVLGCRVAEALTAYASTASAIVARRHVLAVGIDESATSFVGRARELRQWGDKGRWQRRGVLALSRADRLDLACLETAARARLAGIALPRLAAVSQSVADAANRLELFIAAPADGTRG